jgi:hypothetical protein
MKYDELNGHFRERIRERVAARLAKSDATNDANARDFFVLCIILLADENNLKKAADRLYEMKRTNGKDSITYDEAVIMIAKTYETFPVEVSILLDLYQMQENQNDIMDIIAHTEVRLLENRPAD